MAVQDLRSKMNPMAPPGTAERQLGILRSRAQMPGRGSAFPGRFSTRPYTSEWNPKLRPLKVHFLEFYPGHPIHPGHPGLFWVSNPPLPSTSSPPQIHPDPRDPSPCPRTCRQAADTAYSVFSAAGAPEGACPGLLRPGQRLWGLRGVRGPTDGVFSPARPGSRLFSGS